MMRAFIAFKLPEEVIASLGDLQKALKQQGLKLRWVRPDNIHLTLWQVDERQDAGISDGWGATLSFSRELGHWLPFLRIGYGDGGGAILDRSISTGFAYATKDDSGRFGLGLNWGQPNDELYGETSKDQYTIESYYRMQLLKHLQVTPNIQLLLNPVLNPQEDKVWVFGLRARLAF
mgnify:CR=1 FL=1